MAKLYEGKNALITGAASGIGKCLAQHLVDNGARVICCDRAVEAGQATAEELNAKGSTSSPVAYFIKMDVTSWDDVEAAFIQAGELLQSKLDFVFANAGTALSGFPDKPGKPPTFVIDINVVGVIYTVQAAVNHFRSFKSGGSIIATSSLSGLYPFPHEPIYSASKHAVIGLIRSTALRTFTEGIYLNVVAAGGVESATNPPALMAWMKANGVATTYENIIKAFDLFLTPDCRLTGQVVEAVEEKTRLVDNFPVPQNEQAKKVIQL